MVKKKNIKKKKMTKEQKAENKKRRDFSKKIENIFVFSGFKKNNKKGKKKMKQEITTFRKEIENKNENWFMWKEFTESKE